jgi:hypothetical protein
MGCVVIVDDASGCRDCGVSMPTLISLKDLSEFATRHEADYPYFNMFLKNRYAFSLFFDAIIYDVKGIRPIAPMHLQTALDTIIEAFGKAEHYVEISH